MKMTGILTILLLTLSLTAIGQTCDTINGKVINCIDTSGLKQGYWEITRKKIIVSGYSGLGSKEGCRYFEKADFIPVAKGHYKDGKKIGTWDYYSDNDHLISVDKQITYYSNGNQKIENGTEQYSIEINKDTSEVTGQFFHDFDTIQINCKNQLCVLTLTNKTELITFPFSDIYGIEYELLRLRMGIYDREIRRKVKGH